MYFPTWQLLIIGLIVGFLFWFYSPGSDEERKEKNKVFGYIWLALGIAGIGYILFWVGILALTFLKK